MGTRTPKPKPATKKSAGKSEPKKKAEKQPERHSTFLKGNRINPEPIRKGVRVADLIDNAFTSYNAGRLREACRLLNEKMLGDDCTVGVSLSGALTPTGMGKSVLIPLIEAGFIDWIVSTGANLYHDAHFGIGLKLHYGSPFLDDTKLRSEGVVRIYDILFDYHVLLDTDRFFRTVLSQPEFSGPMSTAEFHHRVGRYVHETEKKLGIGTVSLLSAAYQYDVPIYTSSPGDSSIGMNVAGLQLSGSTFMFDVSADVNETASIVLEAKRGGGKSGVMLIGGGSPKNFMLQTEPQIQEVLMIDEEGHDYFLQITDARPDTGGLSGATPGEAVSWGKVRPDTLPDAVVCYSDSTIALPMLAAYALDRHPKRKPKRLFRRRGAMLAALRKAFDEARSRPGQRSWTEIEEDMGGEMRGGTMNR
ncbi:MAG TPA: deoxyhypusine synthase [Thermoanaerobaculia bacterium]|nr:deoxyhypusine synthase [Thermoanaerobaculia bacterium]